MWVRWTTLLVAGIVAAGPQTAQAEFMPNVCPAGWLATNSRCIFYSGNGGRKIWSEAKKTCESTVGASLMSIHTQADNDFAYNLCKDNTAGNNCCEKGVCWLGLFQVQFSNTFRWTDATPYEVAGKVFFNGFAPGEPNNVGNGGEDCVHNWDRPSSRGKWNDEPCSLQYPYLCAMVAKCPKGAYQSVDYEPWLIVASQPKYAKCEFCPAGFYNIFEGTYGLESCQLCPAGVMGTQGLQSVCSTVCPKGYWCAEGTDQNAAENSARGKRTCPAGMYGSVAGLGSADACTACNPGFYCPANVVKTTAAHAQCNAGQCGFLEQEGPACSQACPPGYQCPVATACPGAKLISGQAAPNQAAPCGGNNFYCPSGTVSRRTVSAGFYSVGGDANTRTGQEQCEPGYFCSGGVRSKCPAGTYVASAGAQRSSDCLSCDAGFLCPANEVNTGPRTLNCYDLPFINSMGTTFASSVKGPEMVFCPKGSSVPTLVSNGFYTLPEGSGSRLNRESQTACTTEFVCTVGIRRPLISFNGRCADGKETFSIPEMAPATANVGGANYFGVAVVDALVASSYTVSYALNKFEFFDSKAADCKPTTAAKNGGIFAVNAASGALSLTRSDLNYEICPNVQEVKYTLVVSASAKLKTTGAVQSTVDCAVTINVEDRNDKPLFVQYDRVEGGVKVYERQIFEKVDRNVPVANCDSEGQSFGCPSATLATSLTAELQTFDEDDGTVLRYSVVASDDGATGNDRPFKVDPCTGLVSARFSRTLAYKQRNTYTYTIKVEDDGNSGAFPVLSEQAKLIIHIIDINDPPVIAADPGTITIMENMPAGTATSEMVTAFDEDGDPIDFIIVGNDGDAFKIENNKVVTTLSGAAEIDFESSKVEYFLEIEAQDGRGGSSKDIYVVRVVNTNDPPRFFGETQFFIKENSAANTPVAADHDAAGPAAAVKTFDSDNQAGDVTSFTITGGTGNGKFTIDAAGVIRLMAGVSLDFEDETTAVNSGTGRGFTLEVTATSSGIPGDLTARSSKQMVTVYIADVNEAPLFAGAIPNMQVLENWPVGFSLPFTFEAEDPDNKDKVLLGEFAPQQSLAYSLAEANEYFAVDTDPLSGKGVLKVAKAIDYEALGSGKTIQVKVRAQDNGAPARLFTPTATITVVVVDKNEPPSFGSNSRVAVSAPENQAFLSSSIGTTDVDTGVASPRVLYSVLGGNGDLLLDLVQTGDTFQIKTREFVKGSNSQTRVVLDFEQSSKTWEVLVLAQDQSTLIPSRVADVCDPTVPSSCGDGAFCVNSRCLEKCFDTATTLAKDIPVGKLFECDYAAKGKTRAQRIAKINGVDAAIFRESAEMTFVLAVQDRNDAPQMQNCPIDTVLLFNLKNQNQDIVAKGLLGARTVDEDTNPANIIGQGKSLTYSLVGAPSYLSIVSPTSLADAKLTYSAAVGQSALVNGAKLSFDIRAVDSDGLFSTCAIKVDVIESNTVPTLQDVTTTAVTENIVKEVNQEVVFLDSLKPFYADPDVGDFPTFFMSFSPFVNLDPASGKITMGDVPLDYEGLPDHKLVLVIQVKDRRGAEAVAKVTIPVKDVPEPPTFGQLPTDIEVEENKPAGTTVGNVGGFVSDPDENDSVTISLVSCQGAPATCPFAVSAQGVVTTTSPLDFEAPLHEWVLVLRATDSKGLFAEAVLPVIVKNVNEAPFFKVQSSEPVVITENEVLGNSVLFDMTRVVDDPDAIDTPLTMVYAISSGNVGNTFLIQNGALKLSPGATIDYEAIQSYTLTIRATDSGGLFAQQQVLIQVANVNDVTISSVSISGATVLGCNGGTSVVLSGSNFGLSSGTDAHTVVVKYTSVSTGAVYTCGTPVRTGNTKISCKAQAGVGVGFQWTVQISVAGKITDDVSPKFSTPALSYAAPVLQQVTGADQTPTRGNSKVLLSGSCLGAASDFPKGFASAGAGTSVSYCTALGLCLSPACVVKAANQLECTTRPGVGRGFQWVVSIAGSTSGAFSAGSYTPPSVTSASFDNLPSTGVFSQPLVLSGDNFGALNSVPDEVALTLRVQLASGTATRAYQLQGCKVSQAFVQITCAGVEPGMGKDMELALSVGQQSTGASSIKLSYAAPTVLSLSGEGAAGASTAGGQQVIVRGSGFGPACGVAGDSSQSGVSCSIVQATYSRGSTRASDGELIVYRPSCAVVSQSQIVCITTPGSGARHTWTFNTGGHVTTFTLQTTSYDVPTVGGYAGPGARLAETRGGQEVIIKGSNFGPLDGAPISALYGSEGNEKEFTPTKCRVVFANDKVACETAAGAGLALKWTLFVDGQESIAATTDYGPPAITAVAMAPGQVGSEARLSNNGGQRLLLSGSNFGPSFPSYLEQVTYGPPSNPAAYVPVCEVAGHQAILCTTPPGVGTGLRWSATVKGQTSVLTGALSSYEAPALVKASAARGSTEGGFLVRLTAEGLPMCDATSAVRVQFGAKSLVYANFYDEAKSTSQPVVLPGACPVSSDGIKAIDFEVPEMDGEASQSIRVLVTSRLFADEYLTAALPFTYDPPRLDSVYAEPVPSALPGEEADVCAGQLRVTLRGANFCKSPSCCQAYLNGRTDSYVLSGHSHRTVALCTSEVGFVFVQCGAVKTNVLSFNAESPFIFQTTTSSGVPLSEARYPTKATGTDKIFIWGLYFGIQKPRVKVGDLEVFVEDDYERMECDDPRIPPNSFGSLTQLDSKCFRASIVVPDGRGLNNAITVISASNQDQKSQASNVWEFVNYKPPVITKVEFQESGRAGSPTEGQVAFAISGTDFSTSGEVRLLELVKGVFGSQYRPVSTAPCTFDHAEIICLMPSGEGSKLAVFVSVGNQATTAQNGQFTLSYLEPEIDTLTFQNGALGFTEGGDVVLIKGRNFGRPFTVDCPSLAEPGCTGIRPVLKIGALECALQSNTHTEIQCLTPEGEGKDLVLAVVVRGQEKKTDKTFSYAAPTIDAFTPSEASTDGRKAGDANEREEFRITGSNFGVNRLSVYFTIRDQAGVEDRVLVADRNREKDVDTFRNPATGHKAVVFFVPPLRGKDIRVEVVVAGQLVAAAGLFSYKKPEVLGIVTKNPDGTSTNWKGGSTTPISDKLFEQSRRRRSLLASPDVIESAMEASDQTCQRSILHRGLSWKVRSFSIYRSNYFTKSVELFGDELCSPSKTLLQLDTDGELKDLAESDAPLVGGGCLNGVEQVVYATVLQPLSSAGQSFLSSRPSACCDAGLSWDIAVKRDITSCLAQEQCKQLSAIKAIVQPSTAFGAYVVIERTKLFISGWFPTVQELTRSGTGDALRLPEKPSAVMVSKEALNAPSGPTSGCYEFESYRSFLERRRIAFALTGSALNVYRKCVNKALMELTGDNFSADIFNSTRQIRIFFYKDQVDAVTGNVTRVEFEAATTTSPGNYTEVCTAEEGCVHGHKRVVFQIPPGYGRNMHMLLRIGNQEARAVNSTTGEPLFFHYEQPKVDFTSPGSLFNNDGFLDASGNQEMDLVGDNFGGVSTPVSVLINGRECGNATWRSGEQDEEGQPFVTCSSPKDITGPKSALVCVGGQASFFGRVPSDALQLAEADRLQNSKLTREMDPKEVESAVKLLYINTASITNSRCKSTYDKFGNARGSMGGIGELCTPCPAGSVCNEPDSPFSPPSSAKGFYRIDVPVFETREDGSQVVSERASRRCPAERWDKSFEAKHPDIVLKETCDEFVSCEPAEACSGGNECGVGYTYNYERCVEARKQEGRDNSCGVILDPFSGTYVGNHSQCNPNPASACAPDRPWECATCEPFMDAASGQMAGQCVCSQPARCSLCTVFKFFRLNNRCKECPDNPELVIMGFCLVIVGTVVGGYYLSKKNINLALFSIVVDYLQVLAIFASVNIVWPEALLAFFNLLSIFNLNIDIAAPECLVPTLEYETKWFLMETLPIAVLASLFVAFLVFAGVKFLRYGTRAKLASHLPRLISVFLLVMYVMYLNVTRKSLDVFNCNPLPLHDDGYTYTSFTSLSCDGGSLCRCGEGVQLRLQPLAIVFLLLYTVGFPVLVYAAISSNKENIMEDQYLRASGVGNMQETNPRAYDLRKKYSGLYMHFKPERVTWMINTIARKAAIAAAALLFRGNSTFQLSVILLILFSSFCVQLQYRPYMSTGERSIVLKELDEKAEKGKVNEEFAKFTEMQKKVQGNVKLAHEVENKKEQRRVGGKDMWNDSKLARHAKQTDLQRRAGELFFDYNTVEAILLASAIFTCLGGVMFSSGRFEERKDINDQRDAISYLVIICVVLTMMYIVLVITAEIFPTVTVRTCTRCLQALQRRKPEEHEVVDLDAGLNLQDNPIFNSNYKPGEKSMISDLAETQAELDKVSRQNEALRRELANQEVSDSTSATLGRSKKDGGMAATLKKPKNKKETAQVEATDDFI